MEEGRGGITLSLLGMIDLRLPKISTLIEGNRIEKEKLSKEQEITPAYEHNDL